MLDIIGGHRGKAGGGGQQQGHMLERRQIIRPATIQQLTLQRICGDPNVLALGVASAACFAAYLTVNIHNSPILEGSACANQQKLAAIEAVHDCNDALLLQGNRLMITLCLTTLYNCFSHGSVAS